MINEMIKNALKAVAPIFTAIVPAVVMVEAGECGKRVARGQSTLMAIATTAMHTALGAVTFGGYTVVRYGMNSANDTKNTLITESNEKVLNTKLDAIMSELGVPQPQAPKATATAPDTQLKTEQSKKVDEKPADHLVALDPTKA